MLSLLRARGVPTTITFTVAVLLVFVSVIVRVVLPTFLSVTITL